MLLRAAKCHLCVLQKKKLHLRKGTILWPLEATNSGNHHLLESFTFTYSLITKLSNLELKFPKLEALGGKIKRDFSPGGESIFVIVRGPIV